MSALANYLEISLKKITRGIVHYCGCSLELRISPLCLQLIPNWMSPILLLLTHAFFCSLILNINTYALFIFRSFFLEHFWPCLLEILFTMCFLYWTHPHCLLLCELFCWNALGEERYFPFPSPLFSNFFWKSFSTLSLMSSSSQCLKNRYSATIFMHPGHS